MRGNAKRDINLVERGFAQHVSGTANMKKM